MRPWHAILLAWALFVGVALGVVALVRKADRPAQAALPPVEVAGLPPGPVGETPPMPVWRPLPPQEEPDLGSNHLPEPEPAAELPPLDLLPPFDGVGLPPHPMVAFGVPPRQEPEQPPADAAPEPVPAPAPPAPPPRRVKLAIVRERAVPVADTIEPLSVWLVREAGPGPLPWRWPTAVARLRAAQRDWQADAMAGDAP